MAGSRFMYSLAVLVAHVPCVASFGAGTVASQRHYYGPTCPYMSGRYTCSKSATRQRTIPSLEACKAMCDTLAGCKFVMWSTKFAGYCYTAADCATSGSKNNCNLQLYSTTQSAPVNHGGKPTLGPTHRWYPPTRRPVRRNATSRSPTRSYPSRRPTRRPSAPSASPTTAAPTKLRPCTQWKTLSQYGCRSRTYATPESRFARTAKTCQDACNVRGDCVYASFSEEYTSNIFGSRTVNPAKCSLANSGCSSSTQISRAAWMTTSQCMSRYRCIGNGCSS